MHVTNAETDFASNGTSQTVSEGSLSRGQLLLLELQNQSLILREDWQALAPDARQELCRVSQRQELLDRLVEHHLLTEYQVARIKIGNIYGLILGNYRVLDRLGSGGMGVVFKAEHAIMRRIVAVKVLPLPRDEDSSLLLRFVAEMRAVAELHHPNIVGAIDAGKTIGTEPEAPVLHYFVMEYVPGEDLEVHVKQRGPLPAAKACDLIYQVASALAEADRRHLVHRDIKPSNVLVTPEGQAKLLDFGLVRHKSNRLTEPGSVLGTVDYVAPEQSLDASAVDIRADLYSLGGTLFWCLTGRVPFPSEGNPVKDLVARLSQPPPWVRALRPDVPPELEAVVRRLMARSPEDRYQTPHAVMRALLPFLNTDSTREAPRHTQSVASGLASPLEKGIASPRPPLHRILIVDDEPLIRSSCRYALQVEGLQCEEATNGVQALEALNTKPFDLVLLDVDMPELAGIDVLRQLRESPPCPHLKIIMFSGRASADEMASMLQAGADDYLTKPFSVMQLVGRVQAALRLKEAQDRADLLNRHLLAVNAELEQNLTARDSDLVHARNALVLALATLVEHRSTESESHLRRMQRYSRCLAEEASKLPAFAPQIDPNFIVMLESGVPLHDIGIIGLPDYLRLKPGRLEAEERVLMQAHTLIGAETLQKVAARHGSGLAFLQMAIDVARHHHERYDGAGYPDRLAGEHIPLPARIVAVADVYDALRSRRPYKPALSHASAVRVMTEGSPGQFDPLLLEAFQRVAPQLERIYTELTN